MLDWVLGGRDAGLGWGLGGGDAEPGEEEG